jgi:outer membrane protein, heavy metal efflux system
VPLPPLPPPSSLPPPPPPLPGCRTAAPAYERDAREAVATVGRNLRPASGSPALPALEETSPLSEYVRYAVLKHPQVAAAYYDWKSSVEAITPARALPDPQFTFEADITDMLMTLMPGLMFDVMAPGKRAAMGREAAARSEVAYRAYAAAVVRTAADVHKTWIELAYAEDSQRIYQATIRNVEQSLALASTEFSTARGMTSLEQLVRLQNLVAEHHTHHAAFEDRLVAARARFKSALGLTPADIDPPWPRAESQITALPDEPELWRAIQAANPQLASMRAMVEMAVSEIAVAQKARTPDFTLGAMADVKANPLMVRPTAAVALPIWRNKIAATIAAAEARRDAAIARVEAEQLSLAAELAQMLFMIREADRMIGYIDQTALPNLERVIASAGAGYQAGMGSATMIPEAYHMILTMRLERATAVRERELAAAELLVLLAGQTPAGAPLLTETRPVAR